MKFPINATLIVSWFQLQTNHNLRHKQLAVSVGLHLTAKTTILVWWISYNDAVLFILTNESYEIRVLEVIIVWTVNTCWNFHYDDFTVTSFINIKLEDVEILCTQWRSMAQFKVAIFRRLLFWPTLHVLIKATPTIVGEAFIFYLWTFFYNAPIQPRDDVAEPRQKYISG